MIQQAWYQSARGKVECNLPATSQISRSCLDSFDKFQGFIEEGRAE